MSDRPRPPLPHEFLPSAPSFPVTSTDLTDGGVLPDAHVEGNGAVSPQLVWSGAPDGTRGYVVTCYDPDAPTGSGFWHWVVYGIPAGVTELPRGAGTADDSLPTGAHHARNDYGRRDFGGAAPPPGHGPHRYVFTVHAVDTDDLGVDPDTPPAKVGFHMFGHVIGRGTIVAEYENRG